MKIWGRMLADLPATLQRLIARSQRNVSTRMKQPGAAIREDGSRLVPP